MSAPRIIAGTWRGRRLDVPEGRTVRPTSERMREALFNIIGPDIADATLLDLFAGSGAIGLEALSRGAAHVTFVERDRDALNALRSNIAKLGATERCRLMSGDALHVSYGRDVLDFVYIDPPYASDHLTPCLDRLAASGLLGSHSQVIVEHASKWPIAIPRPFTLASKRRYGAGSLAFLALDHPDATYED